MATPRTIASSSGQSRAPASAYLRRKLCAAGLTQDAAGALIGREGRQIRRWLTKPPPVLLLLVELEAANDNLLPGRAVAARRPHKPQVDGSIPSLATNDTRKEAA